MHWPVEGVGVGALLGSTGDGVGSTMGVTTTVDVDASGSGVEIGSGVDEAGGALTVNVLKVDGGAIEFKGSELGHLFVKTMLLSFCSPTMFLKYLQV
jgi:hypothetical protein